MTIRRSILSATAMTAAIAGGASGVMADGELVIGVGQYPSSFNPLTEAHVVQSLVHGMTRRPITEYGTDWELMCFLCTELPTEENGRAEVREIPEELGGGEGWAVTYTLLPEAVWGDGTPITTEDVMYTWEVGRHPQSGVINFELFANDIVDIEVVDDKTFTLQTDNVSCNYQGINNFDLIPAHLEREVFEAAPEAYPERNLYDTDTANAALWYGPYRVVEIEPGANIYLERNPHWWGEAPFFDSIRFKVIESTPAMEANLLAGEIDYIAGEDGLSLDQTLAFEQAHGDDYAIVYQPSLLYEHVDLNLENPILADLNVRRALLHAIDREAISTQLFAGEQPVAHSNINPLDSVYNDVVPIYPYDPQLAAQMLDEAGWTLEPGNDVRTNAAGDEMTLTIMTTAGNTTRELVQQVLQSQWRDVGVDVRIKNEPARVLFGQTIGQRQFDSMAMFAWISAPNNIPRTTLHSTMVPTEENNWAGQNYTGFTNTEVDQIIDDLEVVCDEPARQELWDRLQVIYSEELPVLPLYFRAQPFVMAPWLEGITPTGHMGPSTLWVENWRRAE